MAEKPLTNKQQERIDFAEFKKTMGSKLAKPVQKIQRTPLFK
jgi:hypothetical protein